MKRRPKKTSRQKDMTQDYLSGAVDEDRVEQQQRFSPRNKNAQREKMLRTALMRAEEQLRDMDDIEALPVGTVLQVYSLYSEVEYGGTKYLAVVRKTLSKVSDTQLVVGDQVRLRPVESEPDGSTGSPQAATPQAAPPQAAPPQAVIEQILPRTTVLARSDSFKAVDVHPIVANAQQMLIVASLHSPEVKWGLVDRMLVAAQSGGLRPIVCLNKVDLASDPGEAASAARVLSHYNSKGIQTLQTSVTRNLNIDALRDLLRDQTTVLAGHSGVGKSSLINAVQPTLDIRIGEISGYTNKGRHTTTFARRYPLEVGGYVIDTPGVKLFGVWNVPRDRLIEFFPDVAAGTAPDWRRESYGRILESLPASESE